MGNTQLAPWKGALQKAHSQMIETSGLNEQRVLEEMSFVKQMILNNPALQKCSANSIIDATLNVSRTKLTFNPVKEYCALVPRGNTAVFTPMYQGLIHVLTAGGTVKQISAHIVYLDEVESGNFLYNPAENKITHNARITMTEEEEKTRKMYCGYSRAVLADGTVVFHVVSGADLRKAEKMSPGFKSGKSYRNTWREKGWKKTVIRSHFKELPKADDYKDIVQLFDPNEGRENKIADIVSKKRAAEQAPTEPAEEATYTEVEEVVEEPVNANVDNAAEEVNENVDKEQGQEVEEATLVEETEVEAAPEEKPKPRRAAAKKTANKNPGLDLK